jgi:hypothetical protein
MFKAKIDKANYGFFKEAVKVMSNINSTQLTFVVTPNSLDIGQFGISKSEAGVISFHKDFFSEYECDKEKYEFVLNSAIMKAITERFKDGAELLFSGDFTVSHEKKKMVVPTYIQEDEAGFPEGLLDIDYTNVIRLPNTFVTEAIKDMQVDSSNTYAPIVIDVKDKKFSISRSTELISTIKNTIDVESDADSTLNTDLSGLKMIMISDLAKRAEDSRISFEDGNNNILISYVFSAGVKMKFAISQTEADDYDVDDKDYYDLDEEE